MKHKSKHRALLIGVLFSLSLWSCSDEEISKDKNKIECCIHTNPTNITEILNPNVDVRSAVAFVANVHDTPARELKERTYSPLLKYGADQKLSPVFLEGTFDRNDVPTVTNVTRLSNGRYYMLFNDIIKYKESICTLFEFVPPSDVRCIDSRKEPATWVDRGLKQPSSESDRNSFVFHTSNGDIFYTAQGNIEGTYKLMKRSKSGNLVEVHSGLQKQLVKSSLDKFYSFCAGIDAFCEINQNGSVLSIIGEVALTNFNALSDDRLLLVAEPSEVSLFYFVSFHLKVVNMGGDIFNFTDSLIPFDQTDEDKKNFHNIRFSFEAGGNIYAYRDAISLPDFSYRHSLLRLTPHFEYKQIAPSFSFGWKRSDIISGKTLVVSGRGVGRSDKMFQVDLNTLISQEIPVFGGYEVKSVRAVNDHQILAIIKKQSDSEDQTSLVEYDLRTNSLKKLMKGAELYESTIYSER